MLGTLLKRLDLLRKEAREMDRQKRNVRTSIDYALYVLVICIDCSQFAAELEAASQEKSRQQRQLQRVEQTNKQLKEELETKSSQQNSKAAANATDHQQKINK